MKEKKTRLGREFLARSQEELKSAEALADSWTPPTEGLSQRKKETDFDWELILSAGEKLERREIDPVQWQGKSLAALGAANSLEDRRASSRENTERRASRGNQTEAMPWKLKISQHRLRFQTERHTVIEIWRWSSNRSHKSKTGPALELKAAGKSTRGSEKSRARGKSQETARESVNKNHNRTVGSSSKNSDNEKPILGSHTKDSKQGTTYQWCAPCSEQENQPRKNVAAKQNRQTKP
jgi:hypothetical protein